MKQILFILLPLFITTGCKVVKTDRKPEKDTRQAQQVPAKKTLEEEIQLLNEKSKELVALSVKEFNQGKVQEAVALLEAAVKTCPKNADAQFLLIKTLWELKQYNQVLRRLEDVGEMLETYPALYKYFLSQDWDGWPDSAEDQSRVSIARFADDKQCAISFIFSDGSRTVYDSALPIFNRYGYKATIPVITGEVDVNALIRGTWEEWKSAAQQGFEINNHTMTHSSLNQVAQKDLDWEVNGSYDLIKEKIGTPPLTFVFPSYASDELSLKKVKERHIAVIAPDELGGVYQHVFIPYYGGNYFTPEVGRILLDFAVKERVWLIPMCHAVRTDEKRYMLRPVTVPFLEAHLKDIKAREDFLWVDTVSNVYRYLYEREKSQIRVLEERGGEMSFTVTNALPLAIYNVPLTVSINVSPQEPKAARAFREGKPLDVKINKTKILVNLVPGDKPVRVSWK
jgi:peptidoglycan/xylan/chitin deacetylase (PgdA/CDA1 family)